MAWTISDGKFKGYVFNVALPNSDTILGAQSQEIRTERRLQVSERALIDGGDVEDFGRKPITLSAEVIFWGGDYQDELKAFEAILNQGTSGLLILPDHPDAIMAKFQACSRKTVTDSSTTLSITWIEDQSVDPTQSTGIASPAAAAQELDSAKSALSVGDEASAIPTIQRICAAVKADAAALTNAINNNPLITGIQSVQAAVVNITSAGNAVLNIGLNVRQSIISLAKSIQTTISGVEGLIAGIQNYASALSFSLTQPNPMSFISTAGAIDYTTIGSVSTAVVNGNDQVVTAPAPTTVHVQSFTQAALQLQALLTTVQASRQSLAQNASQGSLPVDDITGSSVTMENDIQDLIYVMSPPPLTEYVTLAPTSLIEVCFENGLTVDQIEAVYENNPQLTDILLIPQGTVVYL